MAADSSFVTVPQGWLREVERDYVYYISPDHRKLTNHSEVLYHLTSRGTCKCGLRCPFKLEEQFSFDPDVLSLPDNADVGRLLCKHAQRLPETPTAEKPPKRLIKQHSMKSPSGTKKPVYTIIPNLTLSQQKRSPRSGSTSSTTSAEEQIYDAKMIENQALAGLAQLLKNKSLKVGSFLPVIAPPAQTQLSQPQPMQCFGSFRRDLSPLSWLEGLQGSQLFYSEEPQGKGASGVSSQRGVGRGGDKAKPLTINPAAD